MERLNRAARTVPSFSTQTSLEGIEGTKFKEMLRAKEEQSGGSEHKKSRLPTWLGCFGFVQAAGYP